jgi:hypothetical protein
MSTPVPLYAEVDPAQWSFGEPKKNPKNGLNVFVNDPRTKRNPRFQLDRCRCPFGVQDGIKDDSAPTATPSGRKNLELAVASEGMQRWGAQVDAAMIGWVTANSMNLFKKEMKQPTVEALYRTLLAQPNNPSYSPLLRIKVNDGGKQATQVKVVVDEGDSARGRPLRWRKGTLADISPQSEVIPIVEAVGLWFVSKGCGMTLVATDLLVFPATARGGFDFALGGVNAERVESDEEDTTNAPEVEPSVLAAPTVIGGGASLSVVEDAAMEGDSA